MRTRHRNDGSLDAFPLPALPSPYYMSGSVSFTYTSSTTSISGTTFRDNGQFRSAFGVDLDASMFGEPDTFRNPSSGILYYMPSSAVIDAAKGAIRGAVEQNLYYRLIRMNTGTIEFARSDNRKSMTDVIGSKFQSKQGKEFVVNPCTSSSMNVSIPPAVNGGKDPVITVNASMGSASIRSYSINYNVTVRFTEPTIGLPLFLYEKLLERMGDARATSADSAFQTAFSKVSEGEAEVLTMLAESQKTVNYVTGRLRDIANILGSAKRRMLDLSPSKAADLWLEARYAVRPMMYDVESLVRAFTKGSLDQTYTFRAHDTDESSGSFSYTYSAPSGVSYALEADITYVDKYTAGVYTRLRNNLPTVQTFGLANFAQTAWELVPYSFVIDWFVNVSGFISSIIPSPVYSVEGGFKACRRISTATCTLTVTSSSSDPQTITFVVVRNSYDRMPESQPAFFNFDLELSLPKIVDLMALAKRFL